MDFMTLAMYCVREHLKEYERVNIQALDEIAKHIKKHGSFDLSKFREIIENKTHMKRSLK